jgi:nitroimidazol reductase NimA-like FMN-containing flavoprotein (pyridoxamine 5'-phosphate oxidase superfamily)
VSRDRALTELSESECLRLLGQRAVGRVALVVDGRPLVLPVSFVFRNGAVLFRTGWGLKLDAAVHGAPIAFEIDDVDHTQLTGWSVLVQGQAEQITAPAELEALQDAPLRPWAPGERDHYVRIVPDAISGRRIH